MHLRGKLLVIFLILILFLPVVGCTESSGRLREFFSGNKENEEMVRVSRFLMDTFFEVRSDPGSREAVEQAYDEMEEIEKLTDRRDPESQVAEINKNAGQNPVEVDERLLEMVSRALDYGELTGGKFDITITPVLDLWGIGTGNERIPSDDELEEALALVDYRRVEIDHDQRTIFLPEEGMALDLGGVVKGYAVDHALDILKESGVEQVLIRAGGSIRVMGEHPDGRKWGIAIKHPRGEGNLAWLPLADRAIDTSGDYERYFVEDGIRYHHILDPNTGYPVHNVVSATVIIDKAFEADLLSTSLFLLGEEGLELIQDKDYEALLVYEDLEYMMTPGLEGELEFLE